MIVDLIRELQKDGIVWEINPDPQSKSGHVIMKMTLPDGAFYEHRCSPYQLPKGRDPLNVMLTICLKNLQRQTGVRPDVLARWYHSHGNYPARFQAGVNPGHAYTAMHVALRKLMDGMESVVLWNGFHALDEDSVEATAKFLETTLRNAAPNGSVENLNMFATDLRDQLVTFFKDRAMRVQSLGCSASLKYDHVAMATVMSLAFEKLSGDDCAFGLLGYIFEPLVVETDSRVE